MTRNTSAYAGGGTRLAVASIAAFALLVTAAGTAHAAALDVPLGTASQFVVLADVGITNTGPTTLGGSIGNAPSTTTSPYGGAITFTSGTDEMDSLVTQGAKSDLTTAYLNAAGQVTDFVNPPGLDLAGQTLVPGVYEDTGIMNITGPSPLVLDGGGNLNAVWVFKASSSLVVGSGTTVSLINGAQACHVYWQVTSTASLGTNASFIGTILALTSVTLDTGARIQGRALARNGNVTMDSNTIQRVPCATASGGVPTGDGSTALGGANGFPIVGAAILGLAALGTMAVFAVRRRQNDGV